LLVDSSLICYLNIDKMYLEIEFEHYDIHSLVSNYLTMVNFEFFNSVLYALAVKLKMNCKTLELENMPIGCYVCIYI
jgi:hypothetical protein